jgi:hypothetical protein
MTAFRQRTRLEQARWREARGLPIGAQPFKPRPGVDPRPVGSRISLPYARETGANFLTEGALRAVRARTSFVEREQSLDHQRLWADLLSSEALAFNLFGDLAADPTSATQAVRTWWPDVPGDVSDVRFAHSPGRLDPEWLNSLRAFDAAFVLDRNDGTNAIVALDVTFHERLKRETPKPENLWRYREVHERSGAFRPGALDKVEGPTDLWHYWLEHLLLLSMLQHPSGAWTSGTFIFVHAAENSDMGDGLRRYRELLDETTTFDSITLDELLDGDGLPPTTRRLLRERYLPG